jgi:hypothetical protein
MVRWTVSRWITRPSRSRSSGPSVRFRIPQVACGANLAFALPARAAVAPDIAARSGIFTARLTVRVSPVAVFVTTPVTVPTARSLRPCRVTLLIV